MLNLLSCIQYCNITERNQCFHITGSLKNSTGGSIHNQNKTQYNMGTANLNLACNRSIIKLQLHIDCEAVYLKIIKFEES